MVSNGNVTGLVERLVADGLIARKRAPNDRRAQIVRLTPAGRRAFGAMARAHEGWILEILSDLKPSDISALMALLAKAKRSAARAVTGGDPA
jgi:DNA-binding MarR family transcriptional regulator